MHRPPAPKGALEQLMHPPTLAYGGGVYAAIHWFAARRTRPERDSLRYMRDIAKCPASWTGNAPWCAVTATMQCTA